MHRHYYLLKAAVVVLALVTVGMNSGAGTQQIAGEISQAHATTLHFVSVMAASIRCGASAALSHILHVGH